MIASDGINSRIRNQPPVFKPDIVTRPNRYIWLGTHRLYDAFTFLFEKTEHGWFQAHIYKFDDRPAPSSSRRPNRGWRMAWTRRHRRSPSPSARNSFADNLRAQG